LANVKEERADGFYISFYFICIAKCDRAQKTDCFLCDKFPASKHIQSRKLISEHPENKSHNIIIISFREKSNFKGVEIYQNLYLSHHESLDTFQAKETENNWRKLYQVK
jgi:hypothetical protein